MRRRRKIQIVRLTYFDYFVPEATAEEATEIQRLFNEPVMLVAHRMKTIAT